MSRLFDRTYEITITGEGEARTFSGLRVSFSTTKTRSGTPNGMTAKAWNPAPDTRLAAKDSQATIELRAGYGGNNVLLSRAQISSAKVDRTPPDVVLDIQAEEGLRTLRETTLSISHASGSTVQEVLDEIVAATGLPLRPVEADLSATLGGGFAHVGRPSRALSDLVARIGGSWSIQNGELQVLGPNGAIEGNEAVVLSPSSGLIDRPNPIEKQTSTERQSTDARRGYEVKSLLMPELEPGGLVDLRSEEVTGVFVVDEITHRGDTHGQDWYSEIKCLEVGS
ncbi:MAG: hypothetical protein KJP02_08260 [Octadecabacter sp.]|nr:hypothetical protein [Octadecabacter sp.]